MKTILTLILTLFFSININAQELDSIDMTAGHTLDVFYSFDKGDNPPVAGSEWTIAFSTGSQTASIYINEAYGVELYNTNFTFSNFLNINASDTVGISAWTKQHNDYSSWSKSAYENGATGHPNYGWGDYNSNSHIVNGSKVFILKTQSNEYYKTAVLKRDNGAWHFWYASLDNSVNDTLIYQATDLQNSNFAYMNFDNFQISNREPSNDNWDMLFTNYYSTNASSNKIGVLLNQETEVIEINGVSNSNANYDNGSFLETVNEIGYNWKNNNNSIVADKTFFIKQKDGDIYKLFFTRYDGQSTGKTVFSKEKLFDGASPISELNKIKNVSVFPNPAFDKAHLILDAKSKTTIKITVYNIVGEEVLSTTENVNAGLNNININVNDFYNGIYLIRIENHQQVQTLKMKVFK